MLHNLKSFVQPVYDHHQICRIIDDEVLWESFAEVANGDPGEA